MFKALAKLISKKPEEIHPAATVPPPPHGPEKSAPSTTDENAPIYQSLVMTDEMREALFPTTPRMVSAIFDRSKGAADEQIPLFPTLPPEYPNRQMVREGGQFPIV